MNPKDFFDGKEPTRGINPDEAVAFGAAVQACVIGGCVDDAPAIIDVNSLTLGIETVGGVMTTLIPRNKPIPNKKSQIFSTAADNQDTVTIKIFEGERPMTEHNHLLGSFDLKGIPPAPRGIPQIEVTFELSVDSILHVTAKDLGSGSSNQITIKNDRDRLSTEDIERMIQDAEQFAEEDKKLKERIEAKNQLESFCYSLKNQVEDKEKLGAKLSDADKETILKAIEEKIQWMDSNKDSASLEELESQRKELEAIVQPITSKLYQQQSSENKQDGDEDTRTEL